MNRKIIAAVAVLLSVVCLTGIAVSAGNTLPVEEESAIYEEVIRVPVEEKEVYFAYYNSGSGKGAVAFSLNNKFTAYGETEKTVKICTKDADGNFTVLHEIPKEKVGTWFYGKSELSVPTCENAKNLFGGLSSVGITFESDRTNVVFELSVQPLNKNTAYYIYIPQDYFVDDEENGNMGAYFEIPTETVNNYTGDFMTDLMNVTSGLYDVALFGVESLGALLS